MPERQSSLHSHYALLKRYLNAPADESWVLATVLDKEGSSYRRPGAFMLVSPLGQSYGLVSGGCLEADIMLHARKVLHHRKARYVIYDMREEDSYAAELGIGCNGKIGVLIQPLTEAHRPFYQTLYQHLEQGKSCRLVQSVPEAGQLETCPPAQLLDQAGNRLARMGHQESFTENPRDIHIPAPFNLWVFGGGADAQPLVRMAAALGWRITLIDHRPAYARATHFPDAETVLRQKPEDGTLKRLPQADAVVLMTHNLALDAAWLRQLHNTPVRYLGLLGPLHRRERVLELAGIADSPRLNAVLHGPAGLALGGELPESIALSILAECHACLYQRQGESLNRVEVINP